MLSLAIFSWHFDHNIHCGKPARGGKVTSEGKLPRVSHEDNWPELKLKWP